MTALRVALAVLVMAAPACTVGVRRAPPTPLSPSGSVRIDAQECTASYAKPDARRPRVTLTFDVDETHARVTGTERVVFTPDRQVTELVFRLWLNGPGPARYGGRIEVTRASLPMTFEPAGAAPGTQGTLLRLALPEPSPEGKAITATLEFAITLPRASVDRWGHTARTAWWASAHPMLAWVNRHGWHTVPAVGILGETTANEVAYHDVTVVAPAADTVLGISDDAAGEEAGGGRRRWRFRHDTARDVAVAVGPFRTRRIEAGGVPVVVAASDELPDPGGSLDVADRLTREALDELVPRFGPYPYPSLTVVALEPIAGAGVEYPGLVMLGSRRYDVVVPHEVAHQWFYSLVGNDQGRHPWIDESFASYAEALVNDESAERFTDVVDTDGPVGAPMSYWEDHQSDYGRVVYAKGAGGLLLARERVGTAAFDALLRCYVARNAHRVASPYDVTTAFDRAPEVLRILRLMEALP